MNSSYEKLFELRLKRDMLIIKGEYKTSSTEENEEEIQMQINQTNKEINNLKKALRRKIK